MIWLFGRVVRTIDLIIFLIAFAFMNSGFWLAGMMTMLLGFIVLTLIDVYFEEDDEDGGDEEEVG